MIRIPRFSAFGKTVPSLAFACFCAVVPLLGNGLPNYTRIILSAIPALAILQVLVVHEPFPRVRTFDVTAVLFGLMALTSLVYTVSQRRTEASLPWLGLCIAAYLLARYMSTPGTPAIVAKVLVWALCATVLDQILMLVTMGNEGYPLIFSTFLNKNVYGGVLASTLPLVFLTDLPASFGRAVLKAVYGTIILAGLTLTISKGAWLVAGVALIAITAFCLIRRDRRTVVAVGFAVLFGLASGYGLDLHANQKTIIAMNKPTPENVSLIVARSVTPRLEYWRNAVAIARTAPLIGKGYGSFSETHIGVARWPIYSKSAHSFPVQVLAELGIIGLALFLYMFGASALSTAKDLASPEGEQSARFAFASAALVVLAHGFLDVTLDTPEGSLWFWLLFGIGCPRIVIAWSRAHERQRVARAAIGLACVILLASAVAFDWRQATIDRLATAAAGTNDLGARVRLFTSALLIRGSDDKLLANRATAYWSMGRLDQARDDLQSAIRANAYKPAYHLNLASIALQTGHQDEARRLAEHALVINPTIPGILEEYGKVLVQTGDRVGGAAAIAQAILRQGVAGSSLPPDSLKELLTSCAGLSGTSGEKIRLALAMVEYELGHYAQSYRVLPVYAALPAEDKPIMDRLVLALRNKGYSGGP